VRVRVCGVQCVYMRVCVSVRVCVRGGRAAGASSA
jgi:hypothetical protein